MCMCVTSPGSSFHNSSTVIMYYDTLCIAIVHCWCFFSPPLNVRNFVNEHEFCKHLNKSELCGIKSQCKLAIDSLKGLPVFQKVCL